MQCGPFVKDIQGNKLFRLSGNSNCTEQCSLFEDCCKELDYHPHIIPECWERPATKEEIASGIYHTDDRGNQRHWEFN